MATKQEVLRLKKALKATTDTDEIFDLLQQLEEKVFATQALLSDTKIGVVVGSFKSNPDQDVAKLATSIVKKWKSEVQPAKSMKEKVAGAKHGSSGLPSPVDEKPSYPLPTIQTVKKRSPLPSLPSKSTSPRQPPSPVSPPPQEPVATSPKATRTAQSDGVHFGEEGSTGNDKFRAVCCATLYNVLAFESELPTADLGRATTTIEESAWKHFPPEKVEEDKEAPSSAYRQKMRQLLVNLKKSVLRDRVLDGQISPEKLIGMGSMDLATEEQQAERERILASSLKSATVQMVREPGSYKGEQAWHAKGR
ncbi:hypothetical protein JCM11251_007064 [Rhodosporidiobolus azoricus]